MSPLDAEHTPFDDDSDDVLRVDPSDPFSPPAQVCECYCLHCGRTFMSDGIWLQRYRQQPPRDSMKGFWMCPTPNCDGKGFTFDIFPTDPDHPCNANWSCDDGCEDDEGLFDDDDEALLDEAGLSIDEEPFDDDEEWAPEEADEIEAACEYDPDEPQYKAMEFDGIGLGDAEGEEWKLGLQPGDYPLDFMTDLADAHRDPRLDPRFDQPDQRPREIDYVESDYRFNEDDIPF